MNLAVEAVQVSGVVVARLRGELDHHTSEAVRECVDAALEEAGSPFLLWNLAELSFMDSSGLGVLLGRYRRISQQKGKMAVCGPTAPVRRLLELSGVLSIVPVYDDETTAIAALREA
ncbi:MAG: anti-sigma F factor antagonist [Alicyclobacillaceae bacterium]|nr:anti-sigma F factor antagonist [Alicyclobacillaceae bacterium]